MQVQFEVNLLPGMEFSVDTSDISKDRWQPLQGKTLVELRQQAEEAASREFDLRLGLEWSTWLEVRVQQVGAYALRASEEGAAAQAHVAYSPLLRGETKDGQAFTVSASSGVIVPFPKDVQALPAGADYRRKHEDDTQEPAGLTEGQRLSRRLSNMDHREPHVQYTYLPDTPENRAGLDAIIQVIDTVNRRLQQFLHPSEILKTLARATQSGPALLTGPAPEKATPRSKGPG